MDLNVTIRLPVLWEGTFEKKDWGYVNFLIGPNGTGKTLFATELKTQCQNQGMKPRYLNAERLAGLERQHYGNFSSTNLHEGFTINQYQSYKSQGQQHGLSGDGFISTVSFMDRCNLLAAKNSWRPLCRGVFHPRSGPQTRLGPRCLFSTENAKVLNACTEMSSMTSTNHKHLPPKRLGAIQ